MALKAVGPDAAKLVTVPTENVGIRAPSASQIKPTASSACGGFLFYENFHCREKRSRDWRRENKSEVNLTS